MTSRHKHNHSRRDFLQAAVAAGTTLPLAGNWTAAEAAEKRSANEKLNLAVIGVAGRGGANLSGVSGENIVVLCDIDSQRLAAAAALAMAPVATAGVAAGGGGGGGRLRAGAAARGAGRAAHQGRPDRPGLAARGGVCGRGVVASPGPGVAAA